MSKHPRTLFLLTVLLGVAVVGNVVLSTTGYGLEETAGEAKLPTGQPLTVVIGNAVGTALSLVGLIFFGLMIYGGILWMTDRGNEEHSKKALETIKAAVIGMIIILASYAITSFVFSSVKPQETPPSDSVPENVCTAASIPACSGKLVGANCSINIGNGTCIGSPNCICSIGIPAACFEKVSSPCRGFTQTECGLRTHCQWQNVVGSYERVCTFVGGCGSQVTKEDCESVTSIFNGYTRKQACEWK